MPENNNQEKKDIGIKTADSVAGKYSSKEPYWLDAPGNNERPQRAGERYIFSGLRKWPRPILSKLSLRARLLLGLVVITTIGLSIADVIVYSQTESFLINQVDDHLHSAVSSVERYFNNNTFDFSSAPTGIYGEILNANGIPVNAFPATDGPGPVVPSSVIQQVIKSAQDSGKQSPNVIFSAPAVNNGSSSTDYQVLALPIRNAYSGQLYVEVVAIPLNSFNDTLHHLRLYDLAVGISVLLVLLLFSYLLVRIGMKPLEEIEKTADSIAKGDLSQRVTLAESNTELGRLAGSLNAMLSQIEHAFQEQRSSENKLRQFLADASHELRTPLTSIRGYAELFRLGANTHPEDLERSMTRIEDEAKRMAALVEDLLVLARLDQGHIYKYSVVDLGQIAADITMDAQVTAPEREITFECNDEVFVYGDEASLRQVAVNLVRNAIVHTPSTASIHISAKNLDGNAIFEVVDEGPGIPEEHLEKIFERFYKIDSSRNRDRGGSGLGLAIAFSIIEAHHGAIRVNSIVGAGTRFWIEIPAGDKVSEFNEAADKQEAGDPEMKK